ncbi:glutaminase A [Acetobacter suratthaniensis]|uniref:Glutaminase n=1 Tax=Acetobacter suratthaniensis TaxID=1502841 RepID=A0ABS3LQA3_9PROT|nr:glutaminase A [Acetobacter suratthaniensis]MBO1329544.1 glutaminase A [Acetobacter suratthaniensis]MCX2567395.1 glutaminase A [Acetobacter suratthaniensis]
MKKNILARCTFLALASASLTSPGHYVMARDKEPQISSSMIQNTIDQAYIKFKSMEDGENASYIPYLSKADSKLYGIAIVTVDGKIFKKGNVEYKFPVESVAKIFTLASVIQKKGTDTVLRKIGVNATGLPFNSVLSIELNNDKLGGGPPTGNPLVNAGAIATASLVEGQTLEKKWKSVLDTASAFAGHPLHLNEDVYQSEMANNQHNQAIAVLLKSYNALYADPSETVDLYTRECSYEVNALDLAIMGATLANGGTNPLSHVPVVNAATSAHVLAVMATAGLYNTSGEWLFKVGLPGKSGVGGGIVAVVPGKMAIGVYSSHLDAAGNSVRGQLALQFISEALGINIFSAKGN